MKTDHPVSRMTLGTAQLGTDYGIANREGQPDEAKAFKILETAFDNRVNCLDTAAAYGDSEKIIGKYLASGKKKRSEITIVTKFRLGHICASDTEEVIMRSVEQSLRNLSTDYLDILLIHDPKMYSICGKQITMTFEKLLSGRIIKRSGASCYEFSEIEQMLENDICQAFQIPVNILDTRIIDEEGSGRLGNKLLFARSIFLQGLIFMDPHELKCNLKQAGKYIRAINNIAAEMNISVSQLAVTYARSFHYIDSLVIGAENPEQVTENAELVNSEPFAQDTLDSIRNRLRGAPAWLLKPYMWDRQNS